VSGAGSLIAFGGDLDELVADHIEVGGECGGEFLREDPPGFVEQVSGDAARLGAEHLLAGRGREGHDEKGKDQGGQNPFEEAEKTTEMLVELLEFEGGKQTANDASSGVGPERKQNVDREHREPAIEGRIELDERSDDQRGGGCEGEAEQK
jgi:hypothetical protein